ncbi:MAG: translation initiation factor IF-3 [Acidobacteria bacterium]|nr:translation initiation factor IF-3 [Acidobacteriota bacterium]MDW7983675.1 translation initiation factor IF-3 [Acidobacteriota bacterium]
MAQPSQTFRVNQQIRAREVRLVDEQGQQVGIVPLEQALAIAEERGLDLVEVAPDARPPVCRLLNYSQWLYQRKKKEREARRKQRQVDVKEVKFTIRISGNDYEVKRRQIERFLAEGDKVKVTVRMKGRERAHQDIGLQMMRRIIDSFAEVAHVERPPELEGPNITAVLSPRTR